MGNKLFTKPLTVSFEPEITEEEIEALTYIGFTNEEIDDIGIRHEYTKINKDKNYR